MISAASVAARTLRHQYCHVVPPYFRGHYPTPACQLNGSYYWGNCDTVTKQYLAWFAAPKSICETEGRSNLVELSRDGSASSDEIASLRSQIRLVAALRIFGCSQRGQDETRVEGEWVMVETAIKRPVFIACLVLLMLVVGVLSMWRLPVDQWPSVTFPFISVTVLYPGASPSEMETLVAKPIEDEVNTISGIKRVRSMSVEGYSEVFAEFTLETDAKYAEQQLRDRVAIAKTKLPKSIDEPEIRRFDPSAEPVVTLALAGEGSRRDLFRLADETIRPWLEQIDQVSEVQVLGGRKREVQVQLNRQALTRYELSATDVVNQIHLSGENIPLGKMDLAGTETVYRTMGEFPSIDRIRSVVVRFMDNDVPITVGQLGSVVDTEADETNRAFLNGAPSLFVRVYRQSGSNTVAVADAIKARVDRINRDLSSNSMRPKLNIVRDGAIPIRDNLEDVRQSILLGIMLTVIVVFLFLGNARSTIITGLALPNSLIGAFILVAGAGFSINTMTLLALSLAVGLLVDDAIVVRENIFRHIESGESPRKAALEGTKEVMLAVIATTLTILAVFGPIAFVKGITGQFLREFGLTVCFAMLISLFDALTVAPMLSAYFAGRHQKGRPSALMAPVRAVLGAFETFQVGLEKIYSSVLGTTIRRPLAVLVIAGIIFAVSTISVTRVSKTFLPSEDRGEIVVALDLPPGSSLEKTQEVATEIEGWIRKQPEVELTTMTVGDVRNGSNSAEIYTKLVPPRKRTLTAVAWKERLRNDLKTFASANPKVKDYDTLFGGLRPFTLNLIGAESKELEVAAIKIEALAKGYAGLKDVDVNFRPGKPELRIIPDPMKAARLGVSTLTLGGELRAQVEGEVPAKFREEGQEYDIRVRMREEERRLEDNFSKALVPNVNGRLVRLADVASDERVVGASVINRQDRTRYVQISADLATGVGIGDVMADFTKVIGTQVALPAGARYEFVGQGEQFNEMASSMGLASGLAVVFIYLVLASLYESFVIPFTIMLALPLAVCGAFVALWITRESLNIFSVIACVMLLGIATKNSILLVDTVNQLRKNGETLLDAILKAGQLRLRPILMTSMALIAGTSPLALGLNEASKQRTSMGVAIIGGVVSSTLLTLVVVPAMLALFSNRAGSNRASIRSGSAKEQEQWEGSEKTDPKHRAGMR